MGNWGVGMPTTLLLEEFGLQVHAAFGAYPYLVGSVLHTTKWRDVDVRLILDDEEYAVMGLGDPTNPHVNSKWVSFTLAYSALGKAITGLPIDFQIQQRTNANTEFSSKDGKMRSALGITKAIALQSRFAAAIKAERDNPMMEKSRE